MMHSVYSISSVPSGPYFSAIARGDQLELRLGVLTQAMLHALPMQ